MALLLNVAVLAFPAGVHAEAPPTAPAEETPAAPAETTAKEPATPSTATSGTESTPAEFTDETTPAAAEQDDAAEADSELLAEPETQPTPAPGVEPAPAESATAVAGSTRKSARDYSVPFYQQKRPQWALELAVATHSAFGDVGRLQGASRSGLRLFQVLGEYQPVWFQPAGVLGLGVSAGLYSTSPNNQVTNNLSGLLSYGYQARYEARFIRNQWIVPTVGYVGEWVRYALKGGSAGTVSARGIFYGGMILLSAFDEGSAAELYATLGVSRVYLLAESRSREGSDTNVTLGGRSYFFGLRFEF
jgi:hypothetical protein